MKKIEVINNRITCRKCGETKDLIHFYQRSENNSYRGTCIKCSKGYASSLAEKQETILKLILDGVKQCGKCKKIKDLSEFGIDKATRYGYASSCKVCVNLRSKGNSKFAALKSRYGVTPGMYSAILSAQNYKCLICDISLLTLDKRHIHLDHCHDTGKVRGILCSYCNLGLGNFKDSKTLLFKAIEYLTKSEKQ